MDTSNKYIDMCTKATEIQDAWRNKLSNGVFDVLINSPYGDYVTWLSIGKYRVHICFQRTSNGNHIIVMNGANNKITDTIWLPRQDQLQEMVFLMEETPNFEYIRKNWHGLGTNDSLYGLSESFEQLWLMIAMFRLYAKSWLDENWRGAEYILRREEYASLGKLKEFFELEGIIETTDE